MLRPCQGVGEGGQCPSTFAQLTPILFNKNTAWVSQEGSARMHLRAPKISNFLGKLPPDSLRRHQNQSCWIISMPPHFFLASYPSACMDLWNEDTEEDEQN